MLLGVFHHLNARWFINFSLKIASPNQVSPLFFPPSPLDIMPEIMNCLGAAIAPLSICWISAAW